ncbi:MAG TPA: ribosomal L7Ae/L30e/S12e/Gadd45 family protein [Synergistaceae bacterium]|nr:ribosomal L7Ae/L30e/S12e/Gadd45 family protein [Synergistaceae bacterium]HPQ37608.1 ribosomal L7Ae/L30e/S12e/Gadd45 family protein [Synergistaceae bacterium]
MPLEELAVTGRIAGAGKVRKALEEKRVLKLFVASDAEKALTAPFLEEALRQDIPVEIAESRKKLGRACAIGCGTAIAAIAKNKTTCFS